MSVPSPESPAPAERAPLPRELMVFLTQLSSTVSKSRAYPAGHPVLAAATDLLIRHVHALLTERPLLTIGVARDRLLIEDRETDPRHAVLRDLAARIHRHQIAALQLRPGIDSQELADVLGALAADSWRLGSPLGLERQDRLFDRWPHVTLEPIPLGRLELGQSAAPAQGGLQGEQYWRGLVYAVMRDASEAGGPPREGDELPGGATLAQAIRRHRDDAAYCRTVVSWLARMDDQTSPGGAVELANQRVAELVTALDPETLERLMALGAGAEERREIVFRGAHLLPIPTVLELLKSAAATSEDSISTSLLRILTKLASHVGGVDGVVIPGLEEVLRNSVRQLVTSWDATAEESQPHRQILDLLTAADEAAGPTVGKAAAGTLRIARMGVELGVEAPAVAVAVAALREAGDLATLLELLERGEAAGRPVALVWRALTDEAFLRSRILDAAGDLEGVARVLDRLGDEAADPLLDALEAAKSASRRKWILKRLELLVPRLGPVLVERLSGKPWFVIRNLLGLIASMPAPPVGFSPMPYLTHDNARVRREAFKLLAADPASRTAAILEAARDPDPGVAFLALAAAGEDCPAELAPQLLELLRDVYRDPELRVHAIRLLAKRPGPAARDWLVAQVATRRGWLGFGRRRLVDKSAEMLAALTTLASAYSRDPTVKDVLQLALQKGDSDVRAATTGGPS